RRWIERQGFEEDSPFSSCMNLEPILFLMKGMLDRIFARLYARALRLQSLRICFELEKYSFIKEPVRSLDLSFSLPQGSAMAVLPVLRERLSREVQKRNLEAPVREFS